jgi:hypothetical protein
MADTPLAGRSAPGSTSAVETRSGLRSTSDIYDAILLAAYHEDGAFPWSFIDPLARRPEGDGGECAWKRCRDLTKKGLLTQVTTAEGKPLRVKGIHGKPNMTFCITPQGRRYVEQHLLFPS